MKWSWRRVSRAYKGVRTHRGTPGEVWRRGERQIQEQLGRILHVRSRMRSLSPAMRACGTAEVLRRRRVSVALAFSAGSLSPGFWKLRA